MIVPVAQGPLQSTAGLLQNGWRARPGRSKKQEQEPQRKKRKRRPQPADHQNLAETYPRDLLPLWSNRFRLQWVCLGQATGGPKEDEGEMGEMKTKTMEQTSRAYPCRSAWMALSVVSVASVPVRAARARCWVWPSLLLLLLLYGAKLKRTLF